jgi:hypothetical protein
MEYVLMVPPFEMKPFREMTKKEAQRHFDWYIGEIPGRIELLKNAYAETGGGRKEDLDGSPESLIKLWQWYIDNAEIEEKSEEAKRLERESSPEWMHKSLKDKKMSTLWLSVAMDMAMYFSECFIKEHDTISWGFVSKPKSLVHVNKPVLVGFRNGVVLEGTRILSVRTFKFIDGERNPNGLLKTYKVWSEDVE